jgi:hypothetical protein
MRCLEFDRMVADLDRPETGSELRDRLIAHATGCPACGRRLEVERILTAALRRARIEADPAVRGGVEDRLRDAMRAAAAPPQRRTGRRTASAVLAATAVLAVTAWLARPHDPAGEVTAIESSDQGRDRNRRASPAGAPAGPRSPVSEVRMDRAGDAATPAPATAEPSRRTIEGPTGLAIGDATLPSEIATVFLPLPGSERLGLESGHIVRVALPRSVLPSFGVPTREEIEGGMVEADVLFGEDGLARAIRLVGRR